MNIQIRPETPADYRAVELLTREAFWGFSGPCCDEHYLVHCIRKLPCFVPELDFVAEADGVLAGHILYSKGRVAGEHSVETAVLTFGPLSVLPGYQNKGIGTKLMTVTFEKAKEMGYKAIIIYGHPDYYPRVGFRPAVRYGITTPKGDNYDALMAFPLLPGGLEGVTGKFFEDEAFSVDSKKAEDYNKTFPHKEPAHMLSIDILLKRLPKTAAKAFTEQNITTLAWLNRYSGREMLSWEGMDEGVMDIVNQTLMENGYAPKLPPSSPYLI